MFFNFENYTLTNIKAHGYLPLKELYVSFSCVYPNT